MDRDPSKQAQTRPEMPFRKRSNVLVFDEQQDLLIETSSVEPVVTFVLTTHDSSPDEVSVYFLSELKTSELHQEFFNDPTPTDCMSFPIDADRLAGYQVLGEIFICPKVALDYVRTDPQNDVYRELTLYLVHGLLHLLGYDDLEPEKRKIMEAQQETLLRALEDRHLLITHLTRKIVH